MSADCSGTLSPPEILPSTRDQIVKELLAEMRHQLANRNDAGVVMLSEILATFTRAAPDPELLAFGANQQ